MIPDDRVYTKAHVWARLGTSLLEIGVSEPLLRKISPLISIELPDVDDALKPELPFGELEGHEIVHQLYSPVESRVIEVNDELVWNHGKLLKGPYGDGWLLRIEVGGPEDLRGLLTAEAYREFCAADLGEKYADD